MESRCHPGRADREGLAVKQMTSVPAKGFEVRVRTTRKAEFPMRMGSMVPHWKPM